MTQTQIEAMHEALTTAGIKAKIYALRGSMARVYLNDLGRDITAYITFDEPQATTWDSPSGLFTGCALKVFSDAGYARRQDVMHQIGTELHRAGITPFAPAENPRDMVPLPEDAG